MQALNEMDFKGQVLAEYIYQIIIVVVSLAGFVHGYIEQSFQLTFWYWLAGTVVAGLLTVPSWGLLYRRTPVKWLDAVPAGQAAASAGGSGGQGKEGKAQ